MGSRCGFMPKTSTAPLAGFSRPQSRRSSVVRPDFSRPRTPRNAPGSTRKSNGPSWNASRDFCKPSILITSIVSIVEKGYGWKRIVILSIRFVRLILQEEQYYQPEEQALAEIRETAAFDFIQLFIFDSFHRS